MPVVYIDVLFLINLIFDCILLVLTGSISGRKPPTFRIIFGGFFGGVYSILIFFAHIGFFISGATILAASAVMIMLVFFPFTKREFLRLMASFYLSAFLLGGALSGIFYFSGRPAIMSNGIYYFPLSFLQLLLVALPLSAVLCFSWSRTKSRLLQYGKYCTVIISLGDNRLSLEGLIDSGCSLKDPYLNKPVIIIDPEMAKKLYDKPLENFRLIPYSTIESTGFMTAFSPDLCIIKKGTLKHLCNCTIAVSPAFSGGRAIVNPDVFKNFGGVKNDLQKLG